MRQSDKQYLDGIEQFLVQMHQVQQKPDFTLCLVQFESDFQREFGVGDEQPVEPINIYQDLEGSGHSLGDFC